MEKGYKRLTPDQPVGLRHAGYVISVQRVIKVKRHSTSSHDPVRITEAFKTFFLKFAYVFVENLLVAKKNKLVDQKPCRSLYTAGLSAKF